MNFYNLLTNISVIAYIAPMKTLFTLIAALFILSGCEICEDNPIEDDKMEVTDTLYQSIEAGLLGTWYLETFFWAEEQLPYLDSSFITFDVINDTLMGFAIDTPYGPLTNYTMEFTLRNDGAKFMFIKPHRGTVLDFDFTGSSFTVYGFYEASGSPNPVWKMINLKGIKF